MKHLRLLQDNQLARFLVVGAVNTLFSYTIYATLVFVGLPFALANLIALALGIVFSFVTQGRLVFRNAGGRQFLKFVGVWAVLYFVSIAIIAQLTAHGLSAYIGGAIALVATSVLSYGAQKYFVFRKTALSVAE